MCHLPTDAPQQKSLYSMTSLAAEQRDRDPRAERLSSLQVQDTA
jgi:hypothetical protein